MTDDEKTEAVLTTYPDVLILSLVCGFLSFGTAALAGARAATGNLDFLVLVALAVGWHLLGRAGVNFIERQKEKLT